MRWLENMVVVMRVGVTKKQSGTKIIDVFNVNPPICTKNNERK